MPGLTRRRSLMGYVLRPIAWQLALASRLTAPSSGKLITTTKSSRCTQSRFVMDFRSDQGREKVQAWYNYQKGNTRFTRLEYRKVKDGRVKHEFIVARITSNTLCRFDRRPQDKERGSVLLDEGAPAEDSVHVLSSFETAYEDLMRETEVLLAIKLPRSEDISFILTICEAIQTHGEAATYNLMRYNCYFFSWMIVAAVARNTYDWEIVLSKVGWDGILRTSIGNVFLAEPQAILPDHEWVGIRGRFSRTVGKLRSHPEFPSSVNLVKVSSDIETFRDALFTAYFDMHDDVRRVLRTLLLRSQLGSALKKELHHMLFSGFLSAKLAVTMNQVELPCAYSLYKCREFCLCFLPRQLLTSASRASAEILSAEEQPGGSATNGTQKELWRDAWRDAWSGTWIDICRFAQRLTKPSDTLPNINDTIDWFPKEWSEKNIDPAMVQWKNAWDEVDAFSAQYTTTVTTCITTTVMARLTDMAPEQLILGVNTQDWKSSGPPEGPPSLQEFIRSRMQDHFEMVDRFGFGSSQELITRAEEAMCEIWVASLGIIESGRFRSQRAYAGHATA